MLRRNTTRNSFSSHGDGTRQGLPPAPARRRGSRRGGVRGLTAALPGCKPERTVGSGVRGPGAHRPPAAGAQRRRGSPFPTAPQDPPHLLNSGSFSRSSRAEWQVIRDRSNCAISSAKVLPIWFSAEEGSAAAQRPHPDVRSQGGSASRPRWAPQPVCTQGCNLPLFYTARAPVGAHLPGKSRP